MMVTASPQLRADEAQCRSVLSKCDEALKSTQQENALQKQIIADQDERYKTQTKELMSEKLWRPLAIGAAAAAILEGLVLVFKK